MNFRLPFLPLFFSLCLLQAHLLTFAQEREGAADKPQTVIRTQANAVVLDLVVRDKKGRPVSDLRADEVQVFEDGVRQDILTFRSRSEALVSEPQEVEEPTPPGRPRLVTQPAVEVDPFRYMNLVSLVFDRLSLYGRQFARRGALDFLETGIGENTLVSVFVINHRLEILQPFTSDRESLHAAVERATSGQYAQFASDSDAIQLALQERADASAAGEAGAASVGRGNPAGGFGANFGDSVLAEMTLDILMLSEELAREQQGIASIYALLALVGEQRQLAGRKTVLYFAEGLHVPPTLVDRFHYTISQANQANVSVYSFDARGLDPAGQMGSTSQLLNQAVSSSRGQFLFGVGRATTRDQVVVFENAETSLRANMQGTLADLAESTGGFLISNTNDMRPSMRLLREDLQTYYELSYMPTNPQYDGQFRRVRVEVSRPDVTVQTRNGYFAMPPLDNGPLLFPYEVPLLAALSSPTLPRTFDYRVRALRFQPSGEEFHHTLVMQVPLSNFTFEAEEETNSYKTRFSLMALVKDSSGEVVRKISQDYPLVGPLDKLEGVKQSEMVFIRQLHLAPGKYRLETAAYDWDSNRSAARRALLMVPDSPQQVSLSSLSVIRRIDKVEESANDDHNPFLIESGRIVPDLEGRLKKGSGGDLSVFLVVYPLQGAAEVPDLVLQLLHDGQVVGQAFLELPPPNPEGHIPYVATFPVGDLEPGYYEIRAIARQGESTAIEHGFFTIEM